MKYHTKVFYYLNGLAYSVSFSLKLLNDLVKSCYHKSVIKNYVTLEFFLFSFFGTFPKTNLSILHKWIGLHSAAFKKHNMRCCPQTQPFRCQLFLLLHPIRWNKSFQIFPIENKFTKYTRSHLHNTPHNQCSRHSWTSFSFFVPRRSIWKNIKSTIEEYSFKAWSPITCRPWQLPPSGQYQAKGRPQWWLQQKPLKFLHLNQISVMYIPVE